MSQTEGFYKEKGSKFLAFSYPITNVEEAREILLQLKKEYYDARHHCYAYVVGMSNQEYRVNDDGEPNHSAGDPIYGQIRSFELTNTLVVVIRYFGGTKLGVGGLINAYKTAAADALSKAEIMEIYPTAIIEVNYKYDQTPLIERLITTFEIEILDKSFTHECKIKGRVKEEYIKSLKKKMESNQLYLNFIDSEQS